MIMLIRQLSVPLSYDEEVLRKTLSRRLGCSSAAIRTIEVKRRSLDARPRNPHPAYVLSVLADVGIDSLPSKTTRRDIEFLDDLPEVTPIRVVAAKAGKERPIVVGAGPSGLMAALELAMAGAKPILVERGEDAVSRSGKVNAFWKDGALDPESNVLYGEGGAGLFSDGKLTARSKDKGRLQRFFRHLVESGADPDILIDAEPHIGSDQLLQIVPALRGKIVEFGGEVRFGARLDDLKIEKGALRGVVVNGEEIPCSSCILAVGHSSRDVYHMLASRSVELAPKPFAVGVRLELPQRQIDKAQYGRFASGGKLPVASFRLTRRAEAAARACYSFCMCPGGRVISCASEPNRLTTNGMSYSVRSLDQGNAAFLVPVTPEDFGDAPLDGIEYQRQIEERGFAQGGESYAVPAVRLADFLAEKTSDLPASRSCESSVAVELREVLPDYVTDTLAHMIPKMLKQLNGARLEDALLYGPETRSSSPLRVVRDKVSGMSTNVTGLFPAGEGAGYAGGIVSSAVDGIRQAQACLSPERLS